MASSLCSLLFILATLVLSYFTTPSLCTSRKALSHDRRTRAGFRVELKHVDAANNFTKFERMQRAVKRGAQRLHRLNGVKKSSTSTTSSTTAEFEAPVSAGDGEFLMSLGIGTPPENYSAIVDTGSDLIWTQCQPCENCFTQPTPVFNPNKSSTYKDLSCSSDLCQELPMAECDQGCQYVYAYGDDSSTAGVLAAETFTFGSVSVPGIGFGCGDENQGPGFTQCAGLVGLGRGPLSLVSQLEEPKFAYCLLSPTEAPKTSVLLMGSAASSVTGEPETTPLILNPLQPSFYYVNLEGISVGKKRLPINESTFALQEDGSGGMILDSGTTITYIEESAYDLVRKEMASQVSLPEAEESSSGLDLCFALGSEDASVLVPELVFHFEGADVSLGSENYFVADADQNLCLAMGSSSGLSIFGNIQQQNFLIVHDLKREELSFIATKCSEL